MQRADDDCDPASADGSEDPGLGVACDGPDSDLCAEGVTSCTAGAVACGDTTGDTVETCNNLDDDCDGQTDEALTRPTSCGAGACSGNTGAETCAAGAWGGNTCDPLGGATAETCDNVDNDCDGAVDDGLTRPTSCGTGACSGNTGAETCAAGAWGGNTCDPLGGATAETCDNVDNDCDGAVDDGLTRPTSCGTGACSGNTGAEICAAGAWGGNTCDPLFGATAELCDNVDNDCDGAVDDGLSRPTSCGTGACSGNTGAETCAAGAWGGNTCDPLFGATAELCDNVDNDCDGAVDDGLSRPTSCGTGACSGNTGAETCAAGAWGGNTCDPLFGATTELCDNVDNDCDGAVDDGLTRPTSCGTGACSGNTGAETCAAGAWGGNSCDPLGGATAESCDNVDNDCDGAVDDGLSRPTSCGTGACSGNTGAETCAAGAWGGNTCDPLGGATAETCDNVDNDCDGAVDDGLTRPTSCGTGACSGNTGAETCAAGAWGGNTCDPLGGATAETCDNVDNDCDGAVDDGLTRPTSCGTGACSGNTGAEICAAGAWGGNTCDPLFGATAELCDNVDNDCDGAVDDGLSRPTSCGTGACSGNTGAETCAAGAWGGNTCDPLFGATAELCDNVDNDCDGAVDDGLSRPTSCGDRAPARGTPALRPARPGPGAATPATRSSARRQSSATTSTTTATARWTTA